MSRRIDKSMPETEPVIAEIAPDPVVEVFEAIAAPVSEPVETAVEVGQWAMHQSTPEVGSDLTLLGGFVQIMRARRKHVALPSEYARLLKEFANEEAS